MKTKDLISKLQKLIEEHEPLREMMGEHEIVIDVFVKYLGTHVFEYCGFSTNIPIEKSSDGVYDIISAFKE